jgi:ABC-type uncharacterized transport system auxiliary subunit
VKLACLIVVLAACGGKVPETRYYQLASPAKASASDHGAVVVLEPLAADAAYDDERMVYRTSPFRLDYYDYHRWAAAPGTMVSDYLANALAATGRFRALPRELTDDAPVILGGRVRALEEIDQSKTRWLGHVALTLVLTDAHTGAVVWTRDFDEREPLAAQTPEGLAAALSAAMGRIVTAAAPEIADAAAKAAVHTRGS